MLHQALTGVLTLEQFISILISSKLAASIVQDMFSR